MSPEVQRVGGSAPWGSRAGGEEWGLEGRIHKHKPEDGGGGGYRGDTGHVRKCREADSAWMGRGQVTRREGPDWPEDLGSLHSEHLQTPTLLRHPPPPWCPDA